MRSKLSLLNCVYEKEKARVVLYFSSNPETNTTNYIYKSNFFPYFVVELESAFVSEILFEFKKDILVKSLEKKTKVLAKDYQTLQKTAKILQLVTGKNIILIEPERQFLIKNNWSYYDSFYVSKKTITKINNEDFIHKTIKNYIKQIEPAKKIKLIEPLTRKIILSNILKIKPNSGIKNDQILNILLENEFFKYELALNTANNYYYQTKENYIKEHINLDFSNVLPYLLTEKFSNVGYETLNCSCCTPKNIIEDNVFLSSLVKVEFLKSGFYFLSSDSLWAREYHNNNNYKEKRENYKKQNKLFSFPIGPFFKGDSEYILLSDALKLKNNKEIKIKPELDKIYWGCKKKESFVSKIINNLLQKQEKIEESINISSSINYSNGNLTNLKDIEESPYYLQYLTEYSLINSLIEEIPKFLQHKNTKFYSAVIANTIRSIKNNALNSINKEEEIILVSTNNIQIRNKKLLKEINHTFSNMNLPIPKLVVG